MRRWTRGDRDDVSDKGAERCAIVSRQLSGCLAEGDMVDVGYNV